MSVSGQMLRPRSSFSRQLATIASMTLSCASLSISLSAQTYKAPSLTIVAGIVGLDAVQFPGAEPARVRSENICVAFGQHDLTLLTFLPLLVEC